MDPNAFDRTIYPKLDRKWKFARRYISAEMTLEELCQDFEDAQAFTCYLRERNTKSNRENIAEILDMWGSYSCLEIYNFLIVIFILYHYLYDDTFVQYVNNKKQRKHYKKTLQILFKCLTNETKIISKSITRQTSDNTYKQLKHRQRLFVVDIHRIKNRKSITKIRQSFVKIFDIIFGETVGDDWWNAVRKTYCAEISSFPSFPSIEFSYSLQACFATHVVRV